MANQQDQREIQTVSQANLQSIDEENLQAVIGAGPFSGCPSCFKKPKVEGEETRTAVRGASNTAEPNSTVSPRSLREQTPSRPSPLVLSDGTEVRHWVSPLR